MEQATNWRRKGKSIVICLEDGIFHVIYDYRDTGQGLDGDHHIRTSNAREAAVAYSTALAGRIEREILSELEALGYDRLTGEKNK